MYWQRGRLIFGAELGSREKLVLLAISDHLGSNASAWPSHVRLGKRCGMAKRTVVRSLEWLETHKVITVQRLPGGNNRYQINMPWLDAHQCQSVTSDSVTLVTESHPKEIKKGIKKEIIKATKPARKTASKSKRQIKEEAAKARELELRAQVKAFPKPDGLPDGYAELFDLWVDVRKNFEAWTKHESQTARFHKKMLKAHLNRKDIMRDLGLAHEGSWQGVDVARLHDLSIKVAIDPDKPRRALKSREELFAEYRKSQEIL